MSKDYVEVDLKHGRCMDCNGQLHIIECEDSIMTVECQLCGNTYEVEPDAFADGGMEYWPKAMALFSEEWDDDDYDDDDMELV